LNSATAAPKHPMIAAAMVPTPGIAAATPAAAVMPAAT
jgi:hypothetical protein